MFARRQQLQLGFFATFLMLIAAIFPATSKAAMFLKDRLQGAEVGDYIVTALDNTYTVLIIKEKSDQQISIEEITIPSRRIKRPQFRWQGWRRWVECSAPGHTSWVLYTVERPSGQLLKCYSFPQNRWMDMSAAESFLSKLLTLRLARIPKKDVKRIGPPPPEGLRDLRRYWAPQMVYEGKAIQNVRFEAWRTRWPQDSTELSGKVITVYVPEDSDHRYPSYFPYWLEIKGIVGKAKIRIVDSGRNLYSPRTPAKC